MARKKEYEEFDFSDLPPWAQLFVLLCVLGVLIYVFVIPSLVAWVHQHWTAILTASISIFALVIIGLVAYRYYSNKWEAEETAQRKAFEEEQRKNGLVKFVDRNGQQKWGTPEEAEKEKLINLVVTEIDEFTPARKQLGLEYNYQLNLHGWLSKTFPTARIERQRGRSRPDIVIDDLAIEIKGPTRSPDLVSIADKCMRYDKHFPDGLIIVLFEVQVNDKRYDEWLNSLKAKYPQVKVIRKD